MTRPFAFFQPISGTIGDEGLAFGTHRLSLARGAAGLPAQINARPRVLRRSAGGGARGRRRHRARLSEGARHDRGRKWQASKFAPKRYGDKITNLWKAALALLLARKPKGE
jgi:hypothetical protein